MKATPGTALRNEVILAIMSRWPKLFRVWSQNTGAVKIAGRFVAFGVPGMSDILGIMAGGRFVAIEIKAGKDRMSEKQDTFRKMVLEFGGIHIIGRAVDQVLADLEREIIQK